MTPGFPTVLLEKTGNLNADNHRLFTTHNILAIAGKDHLVLADVDEDGIIAGDGDLETLADQLANAQA